MGEQEQPNSVHQKKVNTIFSCTLLLVCSICFIGVKVFPLPMPALPNITSRLIFTLRCLAVSMIPMFAAVKIVANTRFGNMKDYGFNPVMQKQTYEIGVRSRFLQNTLEQTVLHVVLQLALCTYLSEEYMRLVPIFVFIFVIGRLVYYVGYQNQKNPLDRAYGFVLTISVNVAALFTSLVCLVYMGPGAGLDV